MSKAIMVAVPLIW